MFYDIRIYGALFMPTKSQGALFVLNGRDTYFEWIVQKITITIQKDGQLAFFVRKNVGYAMIHCC